MDDTTFTLDESKDLSGHKTSPGTCKRIVTMDDTIFTLDELKDLSGYKTSPAICDWLKRNGIQFLKNGRGRPLVSRQVIRQSLGETFNNESSMKPIKSINFSNIDRYIGVKNGKAA